MSSTESGRVAGAETSWASRSTSGMRFRRGVTGACPRCGGRNVKKSMFEIEDACPDCAWTFEREEGYWLGAMVILMACVLFFFAVFLVGGILITWPDVPWSTLMWSGLVLNGMVPVLLYRWSKTAWLGLHVAFVPAELEQDVAGRNGV